MEEAQVITATTDDFVVSTLNLAQPHVPPTQEQHDLLLPALFQPAGGRALQIGVGYGALVYALEELGYETHGIDTDLSLWNEARIKLKLQGQHPHVVRGDMREYELFPEGHFDLIVADVGGAFADWSMFDAHTMQHLHSLLNDRGILAFNMGVVAKLTMKVIHNVDTTFDKTFVVPGTQVVIGAKYDLDLDPDRLLRPEPDWLCSTSNLYGEQDLPR